MKQAVIVLTGLLCVFLTVHTVSAYTLDKIGTSTVTSQTFTYWTYYGQNPAFEGTASPSATVTVGIDDNTYSVTTGQDGSWRYVPSTLTGGTYAIDISGDNQSSTFTLFISTQSAETKGGTTPTATVSATTLPQTGAFEMTLALVAAGLASIGAGVVLQTQRAS